MLKPQVWTARYSEKQEKKEKKKKKAHCVTNPILLGYPAHFTINPGLEREKAIQLVRCSALSLNQTLLLLQQCWNFLLQRLTMLLSIHHYYFNIALERKWNCHMVELSCQTSVTTLLWEKKTKPLQSIHRWSKLIAVINI